MNKSQIAIHFLIAPSLALLASCVVKGPLVPSQAQVGSEVEIAASQTVELGQLLRVEQDENGKVLLIPVELPAHGPEDGDEAESVLLLLLPEISDNEPAPPEPAPAPVAKETEVVAEVPHDSHNSHGTHAAPAHKPDGHWSYDNCEAWGSLDPAFGAADSGTRQSPIDLSEAIPASLKGIQISYTPFDLRVKNNGHSLVVQVPEGHFADMGGRVCELKNVHFHTPSEHAVDGKRFAMEVHFVHMDEDEQLYVLGVMVEAGNGNRAFQRVLEEAAHPSEHATPLDIMGLIPSSKQSYRYMGSLTTPPCTENVHWFVLNQPIEFSANQIREFQIYFPMNARPLQPRNERWILSR
ncbi:MAG: carbonic anhydrase family protein [Planctomycetota bacterium]